MKRNIVVGVIVVLVLLLIIAGEVFYLLKLRPKVTFDMKELPGEEKELTDIESDVPALSDEAVLTEINEVFRDVFEIISPDEAIDETDIAKDEISADFSADLDDLAADEKNSQEIDQSLSELSY